MNWALVIGCDLYWEPQAHLKGCVRDALAMLEWLTDASGGGVPRKNIRLLLSPSPGGEQVPRTVEAAPATNENILLAMQDLVADSGAQGERLFIHFSGHGIMGRIDNIDVPAIVPEDFRPKLENRAISIRSIEEYFATTRFAEQFLFFDACRNIPYAAEFVIGEVSRPRRADYSVRTPEQFLCYATSRGLKAVEAPLAGKETGVFTAALLDGLRGKGNAKTWDAERSRYVVSWSSLFSYVEAAVQQRRRVVAGGPEGDLIQVPRQAGEQGSSNPILAELAQSTFASERLTLEIAPPDAAPDAKVTVILEDSEDDLTYGPPAESPKEIFLAPRSYTIRARAERFVPRRPSWRVDLYTPTNVRLEFVEGEESVAVDDHRGAERGIGGEAVAPTGRAIVRAPDRMAIVEIRDEAGTVVETGMGSAQIQKPGWYRARAVTPSRVSPEELFEVVAGRGSEISLYLPVEMSRLTRRLVELADFDLDRSRVLADAIPTIVESASSLTILSVGMRDAPVPWAGGLGRLVNEVFPQFDADAALQFMLVDQREQAVDLDGVDVELRSQESNDSIGMGRPRHGGVAGVGLGAFEAPPGGYIATISGAADVPLNVPVHVFERSPTLLVYEIDDNGRPLLMQFAGSLVRARLSGEGDVLRSFEYAQRFAAAGRRAHAREVLKGAASEDLLANCLEFYLALRHGDPLEHFALIRDLAERTGLVDAWVIDGLLAVAHEDFGRAVESFREAERRGIPLFDAGLQALRNYAGEADDLRIAELSARRLPSQVITTLRGHDVLEYASPRQAVKA